MTGVGAYFYIVWGIWLRHCLNYRQDEFELVWKGWTSMPVVVKRKNMTGSSKNRRRSPKTGQTGCATKEQ